jgi:hypothetical protein
LYDYTNKADLMIMTVCGLQALQENDSEMKIRVQQMKWAALGFTGVRGQIGAELCHGRS